MNAPHNAHVEAYYHFRLSQLIVNVAVCVAVRRYRLIYNL